MTAAVFIGCCLFKTWSQIWCNDTHPISFSLFPYTCAITDWLPEWSLLPEEGLTSLPNMGTADVVYCSNVVSGNRVSQLGSWGKPCSEEHKELMKSWKAPFSVAVEQEGLWSRESPRSNFASKTLLPGRAYKFTSFPYLHSRYTWLLWQPTTMPRVADRCGSTIWLLDSCDVQGGWTLGEHALFLLGIFQWSFRPYREIHLRFFSHFFVT